MIVDAHAHLSDTDYGGLNVLLKQMDQAGIDKALLIPGGMIDVRKMTKYITGLERIPTGTIPNSLLETTVKQHPDRFMAFVCVNPHDGDDAVEMLRHYVAQGFVGLKLAPLVHQFSLTGKVVKELCRIAGELGVPVYTHTLFNPAASTPKVGLLATEFPQTNFIIGHMGFGPADVDAVELAVTYPNVFLETSSGSYLIIKDALAKAGADKLIFGSEFPMNHPKAELEKILALPDHNREAILRTNIQKLIGSSFTAAEKV